jgi:hypothetical protein
MKIKRLQHRSILTLLALLLLPLLFAFSPALAEPTYSVMVTSQLKGYVTPISVPIIMDGQPTGHSTPWNFTGLTGVHNFTVPYEHPNGHPFRIWNNLPVPGCFFTTITLSAENASSNGAYCVLYDRVFNASIFIWSQNRYLVTPNDPAVIAAAGNMTWNEIVDWVANNIAYNSLDHYQFPNDTLASRSGVCREYSGLAVSMLEARGYTAYVVAGNTTGHLDINHAWIAIELNGTLYHFEPQLTWDSQPEPLSWAMQRTAWYFYNDKCFLPATATQDLPAPPPAEIYKVTIIASVNGSYFGSKDDVNTRIFLDGKDTGHLSPYTFTGLKGNHTFAVAYRDSRGSPFYAWTTNAPSNRWFQSIIVVSQGGTFCALYYPTIDLTKPSPAEMQYFITPQDNAVIATAKGKNWTQIINYVSSLPYIRDHSNNDPALFPNQTLNGGYYLPDYALLCCSMLLANGYTAYYASKTDNWWVAWVVIDVNGTLTPVNPYPPLTSKLTNQEANYYANQSGIYPAVITNSPPKTTPVPSPTPSNSPTTPAPTSQQSATPTQSSTVGPSSNCTPNPTVAPSPTKQSQDTPEPSATIPEYPTITTIISILTLTAVTLPIIKKVLRKPCKSIRS